MRGVSGQEGRISVGESERRYVLISDDDGHWYVIPADKQGEAGRYFEAAGAYWSSPSAHGEEVDEPERPGWLVDVGGAPSLVEFTGYTIR